MDPKDTKIVMELVRDACMTLGAIMFVFAILITMMIWCLVNAVTSLRDEMRRFNQMLGIRIRNGTDDELKRRSESQSFDWLKEEDNIHDPQRNPQNQSYRKDYDC